MASNLHPRLTVIGHPLVQHKLTLLRQRETSTAEFRRLARYTTIKTATIFGGVSPDVVHDQPMAGGLQVAGDGRAHAAEADPAEAMVGEGHGTPLSFGRQFDALSLLAVLLII